MQSLEDLFQGSDQFPSRSGHIQLAELFALAELSKAAANGDDVEWAGAAAYAKNFSCISAFCQGLDKLWKGPDGTPRALLAKLLFAAAIPSYLAKLRF